MATSLPDRNIFMQTGLDSGSLTMLGTVVHRFTEPGSYRGTVVLAGGNAGSFRLEVERGSAISQANIDLTKITDGGETTSCCGGEHGGGAYKVSTTGYAVFHVSKGAGGYAVLLGKSTEQPGPKQFDSRELREGDIFTALLLRPGTYSAANHKSKAKGEIIVAYPKPGKDPYRPPAPLRVEVSAKGKDKDKLFPEKIHLSAAQGIIFEIHTPSRIVIELIKPDDGPQRPGDTQRAGLHRTVTPADPAEQARRGKALKKAAAERLKHHK